MLGRDHDVPMRGINPRVENLHGLRAAGAEQAGGQCRLPATADCQLRRYLRAGVKGRPQAVLRPRQYAWGQPAPRRTRLQHEFGGVQVQGVGQGQRLPCIAGTAVVESRTSQGIGLSY